jgi:hypothetical protein
VKTGVIKNKPAENEAAEDLMAGPGSNALSGRISRQSFFMKLTGS